MNRLIQRYLEYKSLTGILNTLPMLCNNWQVNQSHTKYFSQKNTSSLEEICTLTDRFAIPNTRGNKSNLHTLWVLLFCYFAAPIFNLIISLLYTVYIIALHGTSYARECS